MRLNVELTKEAQETMGVINQEDLTKAVSAGCLLLGTARVDIAENVPPLVVYIVSRPPKKATK